MPALPAIYADLSRRLAELPFTEPVTHVYDPLQYAVAPHTAYCERFGVKTGRILLMGMNPGPWGMAQTGVPFGEVNFARDWMGLESPVGKPPNEHPKRPIQGFACTRSEVSGRRLWGFFSERFGTPEAFFDRFFVANYCPLIFLESGGRNRIPEKLPAEEREPLFAACDDALRAVVQTLQPERILGIGNFAAACAKRVAPDVPVGKLLHPSPASPAANRGWAEAAAKQLAKQGIDIPEQPTG